jgi:hypothetical protein
MSGENLRDVYDDRPLATTDLLVYFPNLFDPTLAVLVLQIENILQWPVKVIGNVGYLLIQALEGVACYSPTSTVSTSNSCPQSGHVVAIAVLAFSLIRR